MNRSFFFEDQVYDWGRFQKTDMHTRTKITLKLPLPPPPRAIQEPGPPGKIAQVTYTVQLHF